MAARWKSFWSNLKAFRPLEVVLTALGGIVIGVLGNGTYDLIKSVGGDSAPKPGTAASAPLSTSFAAAGQEGYEIDLAGRRAVLVTTTADTEPATAWALHAAFGTSKAPPSEVRPGRTVLRINQVYSVNRGEQSDAGTLAQRSPHGAASDSKLCFNMHLVEINGTLSVPQSEPRAVSGKAQLCSDHQSKELQGFINEDVLPLAVAKLVESIDR